MFIKQIGQFNSSAVNGGAIELTDLFLFSPLF